MLKNDLSQWATLHTFGPESLQIKISYGFRVTSDRLQTAMSSVRTLRRDIILIMCLGVALATMAACSPSTPSEPIPKATLTKQIFLDQHDASIVDAPAGNTRAIAPMSDGEVVLAGSTLSAWASRIRADGSVAWRYVDPRDDSFSRPNSSQSEFTDAVGLSDGSVVLCGSRYETKGEHGLLLHIGPTGEVISRELLSPSTGAPLGLSSFNRCMKWGDGIVLMGVVPQSPAGMGWMIRLAPGGQHMWEKIGQDQLSSDAITLPDQTLVLARSEMKSVELKTMGPDGAVTNRRTFPCVGACGYINLFQNVGKDGDFNLEVLDPPSDTLIYHLGADLLDREAPVHSELISSRQSFRLPSGALLLFGEGSYQVVVTGIDKRGHLHPLFASGQVWDAQHRSITEESIKFEAVAAISGTEFVSVRNWVAPIQHRGVYVEWFKIE
jgi:hypothetical protein